MKTHEFLALLRQHSAKELIFEYLPNKHAGANYHITEVKNTHIEAVDCGGRADAWNETIVQLWESPTEKDKTRYLSAFKASSIFNRVHSIKPMDQEAEIKFEYGNASFHTAQLFVNDFQITGQTLIIKLGVLPTLCKAEEICGVTSDQEAVKAGCCNPTSGCC